MNADKLQASWQFFLATDAVVSETESMNTDKHR